MRVQGDIILIHGMGCGGEVWGPMQATLEAQCWRCTAPTLLPAERPVAPAADARPPKVTLTDYIADARSHCEAVAARSRRKPIVIGHSLGGLIALALASEGACSKAVCITPAPPRGIANRTPWSMVLYANVLLSGKQDRYHKAWPFGVSQVLLNNVPNALRAGIYANMRYEPGWVFADMMQGLPLDPSDFAVPLLLVSAGRDRIVPPKVVAATARRYQSALQHYPDHGHWIIDEPDNQTMVEDVLRWLSIEPQPQTHYPVPSEGQLRRAFQA
ncbi:lysophospholipase (plasmid) [Phaeobacter inhibens]|nr:lysophospholipase [Phaeobacter inhibens]